MFTSNKFALQSIAHQKFSSIVILLLVFISTICLFGTTIFTENMKIGVLNATSILNADIITVPAQYSDTATDALFEGKACTIFLDSDLNNTLDKIRNTEGVADVSPQLFLKTLSLSCCAFAGIQLIAIDPQSDFEVSNWTNKSNVKNLKPDEIIIGASCGLSKGEQIKFFGETLTVKEVLSESGMGYDESAFISYETANKITSNEKYKDIFGAKENLASMILIKSSDNYNLDEVKDDVIKNVTGDNIAVYSVGNLVGGLSEKLVYYQSFALLSKIFVILLAAVALFSIITMNFEQRRGKVGSLLSVGIGKSKIIEIFLIEYIYLLSVGIILGILLVSVFIFPLHSVIKSIIDIPYKFVNIMQFIIIVADTIAINVGILAIAVSLSFYRIWRLEPAILIGEA